MAEISNFPFSFTKLHNMAHLFYSISSIIYAQLY